uniref:Uncharacterized protein n=1 Tax=Tanacetum cinerariifolium TaxID=118510 RepID=A0A6L2M5T3_TANCI|nr:hypothetical protein [Tanacetum cinerariifolium]
MHDEFEMRMIGELNFFLGLQIKQMEDGIFFNQSKYIKGMLKKFGLEDSKPIKTPMSSDTKLTKDEECESVDSTKYQGMIGTDIETIVYVDSDHAGDYVDRKSTSGICTLVGYCLTSWFSKKQTALAISTTEAEYVSAKKACQQALWMKQALIDYDIRLDDVSIIWSLDELAYGVPSDGPYETKPPSPDDIISVMNPFATQLERKLRRDRGTRKGCHSTSSSTFNQPSSSHLNDDDDDRNYKGTSRASTPSPIRYVNSLTNEVPQVFQNPPNIDPYLEPFYTRQTEIINRQVQIQEEHRGGLRQLFVNISSDEDVTTITSPTIGNKVHKTFLLPGNSQNNINDKGYWDSCCSRNMTGNISYLSDYEPFDGGYVSFGQGGCKITGKGTIKTAKASPDESMLWHMRLGYLNFETMNRFTWTFFLKTKDETSDILRNFITKIENMKDFKAEAVNTDCYVQNMVLVNKSQNKTPYELFNGKFEAKGDEGYFIGYSMSSKAFRVFNKRTKRVEENLHVDFLENKATEKGTKDAASQEVKKDVSSLRYIALPNWVHKALLESSLSNAQDTCNADAPKSSGNPNPTATTTNPLTDQMETLTMETPIPTVSSPVPTVCFKDSLKPSSTTKIISKRVTSQDVTPSLDNISTLANRFNDILRVTTSIVDSHGEEDDISNMETTIIASPTPTLRIHKDHPKRVRPIGTKWVLNNKKDERGIVIRNKARLVAQRHTQEEGIEYDEVFAPVARIEAIRLFLAYASFMGFTVYQMDVKSAFLYGTIDEEVYVMQTPGFQDLKFPARVYKVEKVMYGLHQAPRAWQRGDFILVQVYVDDIIFGSLNPQLCREFEALMHEKFQMSAMDVRSANTPMDKENPWGKDGTGKDVDLHLYRSMIGSLMYLSASKPDIMFAVCACARHQITPKECHLHAVKRIFRYLKGHPKLGLWYPKESAFDLVAYSNSDYGGATQDRKSTTRGCQFLGRRLISWQCKKQTIMATSTTEAKYVATTSGCGQVLWIQNQLLDYGYNFMNTKIYIDNNSAICIVKNPVYHSKTKDIEIIHHFIRDCFEKKLISVDHIHTDDNVANLLTKPFDVGRFQYLVYDLNNDFHQIVDFVEASYLRAKIAQSLALLPVADEPAFPIGDDSQCEACTTDSGLEAKQDRANVTKTSTFPSDSTPRVTSLAADEGSIQQQLNELTDLEGGGVAQYGKDALIKGRSLDEGEEAAIKRISISPVTEVYVAEVPTGSGSIPTASPPGTRVPTGGVPTGSDVVPTSGVPTSSAQEGKIMIDGLDRNNETVAKYLHEYYQFAGDLPIKERIELISWKARHFKGMTLKEIKQKFDLVWKQIQDFIPIGSKEKSERFKRKRIRIEQDSVKKLKTSEEVPEEKLKEMMELIPVEEVYVEALKVKHPIIDWEVHTERERSYWKIIRLGGSTANYQFFVDLLKHFDRDDLNQLWVLVKETLNIRPVANDKDMELWVELKRLYELDVEDKLWTHT